MNVHSRVLFLKTFLNEYKGKRTFQLTGNNSNQVELISTLKLTFASCRGKQHLTVLQTGESYSYNGNYGLTQQKCGLG